MEDLSKSRWKVLWAVGRFFLALLPVVPLLASMSCGGRGARTPPAPAPSDSRTRDTGAVAGDEIVATALSQVGRAYRWGGSTPEYGFDCSGFVQWVYAQHGIDLPRTSAQQMGVGRPVGRGDIRPGDLVFYAMRNRRRRPDHVGIYVGRGRFVHGPRSGRKITLSRAFDEYHTGRYLGARRLVIGKIDGSSVAAAVEHAGGDDPDSRRNQYYTVQNGDYIWKIARRFGVSPWRLLEINGLELSDVLKVGQRLLIPEP